MPGLVRSTSRFKAFADRIVEHFGRQRLEELVASLHAMSRTIDEIGP